MILEEGTHDELVANGGLYAELYRVQMEGTVTQDGRPIRNSNSEIRSKFR
jgi:hypothetical protein